MKTLKQGESLRLRYAGDFRNIAGEYVLTVRGESHCESRPHSVTVSSPVGVHGAGGGYWQCGYCEGRLVGDSIPDEIKSAFNAILSAA
jgi:hypothetical protein